MLNIIDDDKDDWEVRAKALEYLTVCPPRDYPEILGRLVSNTDEKDELRVKALQVLAGLRGRSLADEVIAILKNPEEDREVRAAAADFVGECRVKTAGPLLLEILKQPPASGFSLFGSRRGPGPGLRESCIRALGKLRYAEAREVVEYLSRRDEDVKVRKAARETLPQL